MMLRALSAWLSRREMTRLDALRLIVAAEVIKPAPKPRVYLNLLVYRGKRRVA